MLFIHSYLSSRYFSVYVRKFLQTTIEDTPGIPTYHFEIRETKKLNHHLVTGCKKTNLSNETKYVTIDQRSCCTCCNWEGQEKQTEQRHKTNVSQPDNATAEKTELLRGMLTEHFRQDTWRKRHSSLLKCVGLLGLFRTEFENT